MVLQSVQEEYKRLYPNQNNQRKLGGASHVDEMNLQFFAPQKRVAVLLLNGRDSQSKRLGAKKRADGQTVFIGGSILYRQRGTKIYPGVKRRYPVEMIHYCTKLTVLFVSESNVKAALQKASFLYTQLAQEA